MEQVWKTDWLNSRPVFYNENTGRVSYNVNEVIDYDNIDFHSEGLINYLDFGYSVFEQTPLIGIKFLPPCSELRVVKGKPRIKRFKDPANNLSLNKKTSPEEVINLIKTKLNGLLIKEGGQIILPLSGGMDSRMLATLTDNKKRLNCFTYGVSPKQEKSFEVINAQDLCKKYGIRWNQIRLDNFLSYIEEWESIYGLSTHCHGMYHLEFYKKIKSLGFKSNVVLSGIFGDVWAGSVSKKEIRSYKDLPLLAYSHGLNADSKYCKLESDFPLRKDFFKKNYKNLNNWAFQNITTIRIKMILISYLLSIPRYLGFKPVSPFLNKDVCLSMLSLPEKERINRKWQKDFLRKRGLSARKNPLRASFRNNLDYQQIRKLPLARLDEEILSFLFEKKYIQWINKELHKVSFLDKIEEAIFTTPLLRGILKSKFGLLDSKIKAYNAYLTLKPLETLLKKKREHEKGRD